ncbi:MAG: superfamily protein [Pseudonocardiales bacterium]|nr:superfamily protein [Pseudonocardiales bacterium]
MAVDVAVAEKRPSIWINKAVADYIRPFAVAIWAASFISVMLVDGIPTEREQLILWLVLGLAVACLGVRSPLWVIVDWLPFALFLYAYDYSRGAAETLGMPIHWQPQLKLDEWLFFGHVPTQWLQEHLKQPRAQWWEAVLALTYTSHFIVPYVMTAWFWFRNRALYWRFAGRFLALSFTGIAGYILFPAAPPWAAARCTAADVANQHLLPFCIHRQTPPPDALIALFHPNYTGAAPFVQRISTRGYANLNMKFAGTWLERGQATVNFVAAIPSLHGAFSVLILIFCWRRVPVWWRPVLVAYPLLMMFTLVYGGEHYVSDVLLGWLAAGLVCAAASLIERRAGRVLERRKGTPEAGTLALPTDRQPDGETPWPPIVTTPSSTSASDEGSSSPPARSTAAAVPPGTMGPSA